MTRVGIALSVFGDHRFAQLPLANPQITVVDSGNERADSRFGRVTGRCKGAVGAGARRGNPVASG